MTEESKRIFNKKEISNPIDPRSPSVNVNRTPLGFKSFIKTSNLVLDPRSPTVGIDRTPIQVKDGQKTLHQRPVKAVPIHNSLIDPRSPSQDFLRTPLKNVETAEAVIQKHSLGGLNSCLDPRSPTIDFIRTPMNIKLEDKESIIDKNDEDTSSYKLQNSLLDGSGVDRFSSFKGYIKELEDSKTSTSSDDSSITNLPADLNDNDLKDLQIISEPDQEEETKTQLQSEQSKTDDLVISKKKLNLKHQVFNDENSTLSEKQTSILLPQRAKSSPLGLRSPLATIGLSNSPLVEKGKKKVSNFDPALRRRIQPLPTRKPGFNFHQEN